MRSQFPATGRPVLRSILLAGTLLLLPVILSAQTTFTVTVNSKNSTHPYFGQGYAAGFIINGVQGRELTLTRGVTYTFKLSAVHTSHPLYISTDADGANAGEYTEGVTGSRATGNGTLTFTPGETAPDLLYYQCYNKDHSKMGWKINIVDPISSVPTASLGDLSGRFSEVVPNPARGSASITLTVERPQHVRVALYDMTGAKVATLHDADVSTTASTRIALETAGLAEGVYTCVAVGETFTTATRVVVAR